MKKEVHCQGFKEMRLFHLLSWNDLSSDGVDVIINFQFQPPQKNP